MERERHQLASHIKQARSAAERAGIPDRSAPKEERALIALIGIGSSSHRDDAAGLEVARRVRQAQPAGIRILEDEGEPSSLLDDWHGAAEALVVEGVSSGASPGTL